MNLSRFKVVLVAPKIAENIGAVARLLENYRVGSASLVQPQCDWRTGVATWMATGPSLNRLHALPVDSDLSASVQDAHFVVGFTARSGKSRKTSIPLQAISELKGNVALVFGREDFCLLKEEIDQCTHLCALDTNPDFPTLNLSHSVAVVLSRLFVDENGSRRGRLALATAQEQEPMFTHLREMMVSVGLTKSGNPDRMIIRMRKIFQRAQLTKSDIALLRGLFSSIISFVGSRKR